MNDPLKNRFLGQPNSPEALQAMIDAAVLAEREACANTCETLLLELEAHKYPSANERHLISVTEAGCRGALADAIRARSNVPHEGADAASSRTLPLDVVVGPREKT
jgi:hypothetical protein